MVATWPSIETAAKAGLGGYYQSADALPVQMLGQFDRTTRRYKVTFEDTDEKRWTTQAGKLRHIRAEPRPDLRLTP